MQGWFNISKGNMEFSVDRRKKKELLRWASGDRLKFYLCSAINQLYNLLPPSLPLPKGFSGRALHWGGEHSFEKQPTPLPAPFSSPVKWRNVLIPWFYKLCERNMMESNKTGREKLLCSWVPANCVRGAGGSSEEIRSTVPPCGLLGNA